MSNVFYRTIFLLCLVFFVSIPGFAIMDSRFGNPYITSFTPEDYPGEGQCFDIAVTSDNLVYVANAGGLLEFDGINWRVIPGSEGHLIVSVAVDSQDRVWTGGVRGAGVLVPDSTTGVLNHFLLESTFKDSVHNLTQVWRITPTPDGIYFQSPRLLLRYQPETNENVLKGEIKRWPSDRGFTMTRFVEDRLFVKQAKTTLQEMIGDSLIFVPATLQHQGTTTVDCEVFDENTFLLTHFDKKITLFNDDTFYPLEGTINDYTENALSFGSIKLSQNRFALSSSVFGIIVFNKEGNVVEIINKDSGLPSNVANRRPIFDLDGGLWIPLEYGVARIEINTPIRTLDDRNNLSGVVISLLNFNDILVAGTTLGLQHLSFNGKLGEQNVFHSIAEINYPVWRLFKLEDQLLAGTVRGPILLESNFEVDESHKEAHNVTCIEIAPNQSDIYMFFELNGLFHFKYNGKDLELVEKLDIGTLAISSMKIQHGYLWATTNSTEGISLWRSDYSEKNPGQLDLQQLDNELELPGELLSRLFSWDEKIFIDSETGLLSFNSELGIFESVEKLYGDPINPEFPISIAKKIGSDRLLVSAGPYNHYFYKIDSKKNKLEVTTPLNQLRIRRIITSAETSEEGIFALGTDDGRVIMVDVPSLIVESSLPKLIIREIVNENGDILSSGNSHRGNNSLVINWPISLRFEYSLTSYKSTSLNQYRYRLTEISDEWSLWSNESYKDFTNLNPGKYTFEVMGKDANGIESEIETFRFTVKPPWYRTAWSMTLWFVLFGLSVYGFIRIRINQLESQKRVLEELIKDRTRQLHETQQKELNEINARKSAEIESQRLLTATKLATAVSHEFNNPLAVIKGRVELLFTDQIAENEKAYQKSILDQIEKMKKLVNQLHNIDHLPEVDYVQGIKMLDLHNLSTDSSDEENNSKE